MDDYIFLENAFIGIDNPVLFQNPIFFQLYAQPGAIYYELCKKGDTKALIHFSPGKNDDTWRSPAKGTFAGLSFSKDIKYSELIRFYKQVESSLLIKGAKMLEVLPAPQSHDELAFAKQVYLLKSLGFEIKRCDLNQSLLIDSRNLIDRMSYGNQKRLLKCEREGLVARQLPLSKLSLVYETLAINRANKGYKMSMSMSQLQKIVDTFPKDIVLFGCPDGEHLASAAFCLRLSSEVLYVFYWGDRPEYATFSPVVSVADSIYRYGQTQGFKLLDVGTSTIDVEPNIGLLEFKRGLGFNESLKLVMRKSL
jgi:hypothetical protein